MVHPANTEIFGPFLTAISSKQNAELLAWLGCPAGVGSVPAGVDSSTAEQVIAAQCNLQLPRITENGARIGLLSECGGHGKNFHFHERLSCIGGSRESNRDPATGHSNQVGTALDGSKIFGKYERAGTSEDAIASLDTCGGHFGVTPLDSSGLEYHYHVSDKPPFTIACFGPAGSPARLATVEDCRKLYPQHCGGQPIKLTTARDKQAIEYDLFCPCFDANGSNVDTDWATASSRSAGARDNTAGEVLRTVFFVLSACGAICCFCCHLSIRRARKRRLAMVAAGVEMSATKTPERVSKKKGEHRSRQPMFTREPPVQYSNGQKTGPTVSVSVGKRPLTRGELEGCSIKELLALARERQVDTTGCVERREIVEKLAHEQAWAE